ncbi:MAG: LamG domain-containing protein, partial [Planctomycetota bacterium]
CPDAVLTWRAGDYAAHHRVYFGTDFNDVNDATTASSGIYVGQQDPCEYDPPDLLDWDTTYYWRIDEINDVCAPYIWKGMVWSFTVDSGKARNPSPADLDWRLPVAQTLAWEPGCIATSHDVYLGTDFNDVNNAANTAVLPGRGRQGPNSFDAGVLHHDTTYYWRIDEVGDGTLVKGDVWSFTTIGAGETLLMYDVSVGPSALKEGWSLLTKYDDYPETGTGGYGSDDGPVTWSDMNMPDGTPTGIDLTLDTGASGQMGGRTWGGERLGMDYFFANDQSGTPDADFIITLDDLLPGTYVLTTFHNSTWYGYSSGPVTEVAVSGGISYSQVLTPLPAPQTESIYDAAICQVKVEFDATGAEPVTLRYKPGESGVIYMNGFILDYFSVDKRYAHWPIPRNSTREVQPNAVLSWSPGIYAADPGAHDVYFGTSWDDVNSATTSSSVYIQTQNLDVNTYDPPGLLDLATTYYWRIDERNDANGNLWKGNVWRFTTANYLLVDDMESYDAVPASGNEIYDTWDDGFVNWTGSQIQLEYGDNAIINGGRQSMKFGYNNSIGYYKYSEIDANTSGPRPGNLEVGLDWTHDDVKALTLFFYGQPGNDTTEQMYAALTDNSNNMAISGYGDMGEDMNDVQEAEWHQWDMVLSDFDSGGVDLNDVNKVRVGFGDRDNPAVGGTGTVFFDDIRVYLPKCVPWKIKPPMDFSNNCIVDFADVAMMAEDWLVSDVNLGSVTAPNAAVLHYAFEDASGSSVTDSAGSYTGTFFTDMTTAPADVGPRVDADGKSGNSFHFTSPPASLGYGGIKMPSTVFTDNGISQEITISVWIKNVHPDDEPDGGAFMWEFRQWDMVSEDANDRVLAVETQGNGDTYVFHDQSAGVSYELDWERHTGWKHYAFVRDDSNLAIYVNGVLESISDSNGTALATPQLLYLGIAADRSPTSTADMHDGFTGNVDEWKIFNYALSATEVAYLATDGTGVVSMDSAYNIFDKETLGERAVNFRDYAVLMESWLEELLWPQ